MKTFDLGKKAVIATTAVLAGVLMIAAADARSVREEASITVPYADLNLQKMEGARTLYERLQQAAREACDVNPIYTDKDLTSRADARTCYRTALSGAVAGINNEYLNQLYNNAL